MKKYVVIMSLLMFGSMHAMLVPEYCEDDYYCPPCGEFIDREALLSHRHNVFWKELSESDNQEQKDEYLNSAIESSYDMELKRRALIACAAAAGGKLVKTVRYDGDDKIVKDQLQCKRILSHIHFFRKGVLGIDDVELVRFMLESKAISGDDFDIVQVQSKSMMTLLAEYDEYDHIRKELECLVKEEDYYTCDDYKRVEHLLKYGVSIAEYSELVLKAQSADMADLLLLSLRYDDFNEVQRQAQINKEHRVQRAYEICKLKALYESHT